MTVLVTGGCGFIGSHLVGRLVKDNHEVTVFDDLSTGTIQNLPRSNKVHYAGSDYNQLPEHLEPESVIFHLGFPSASPLYRQNPYLCGKTINEAITVFESAVHTKSKVVFASTSSIYNGNPTPYREDMPIYVKDYYTETRYAVERLAELCHDLQGLEAVGLRFFSVYGKNEKHKGKYANVVTQFLQQINEDESPVVYGDGSQTRDFIYVEDVVDALLLATEIEGFDIFNVGTGKPTTFNQLIQILNETLNKNIQSKHIPNPIKNYVQHTLADITKASTILGFKAKTTLQQGITSLV